MSNFTCGTIIPSSCVPYSGKDLKFLSTSNQPACDATVDDVVDKISIAIDTLNKAIDVSSHTASCLTLPTTKTVASILQAQSSKLCALDAQLQSLSQQVAQGSIANQLININLGCLATAASGCEAEANTYSLISILTLFKNEICAIKANLGI
jgi:hypothetical protein